MNELNEVEKEPAFLYERGFQRRDDEPCGSTNWAYFEKEFKSDESQVCFLVQVLFEVCTCDDPGYTIIELTSYSFNGVYLKVIDRQMEALDSRFFDDETEHRRKVGKWPLDIKTTAQLDTFCNLLGNGTDMRGFL
ncbi:MAG: hypothetical protein JW915_06450 [Chitinispirillaceae bacterium]|nr:hypothetical protein [Chitinispirillaceae bacterium]